jgi:3-oxoacyl-[acyl-carrier-protein] synthase II
MRTLIHFTGAGIVSPLGHTVAATLSALRAGKCGVKRVQEWAETPGLNTHVAALVHDFDPRFIPRKTRRTMSKMSQMLCKAGDESLAQAGLTPEGLNSLRVMLIVGSTTGSTGSFEQSFKKFRQTGSASGQFSTTMFKTMNHSVALNLASYWGFKGAVLSPSSACSTGAQAILLGAEFIRAGLCDIAICGGADEAHIGTAIAFDTAQAASCAFNDCPEQASRPFDAQRCGVVVSEGAAIVVLESEGSRKNRERESLGQVVGWAQSCDGGQVAHSSAGSMAENMRTALSAAGVAPESVGYVNAHATSTLLGDRFEAQAIHDVFGTVPASSLKGHLGHSFAPCGTQEAIATLAMLKEGLFLPNLNWTASEGEFPPLDYLSAPTELKTDLALSNNFAMGGMNVSLVLGRAGHSP